MHLNDSLSGQIALIPNNKNVLITQSIILEIMLLIRFFLSRFWSH